MLTRESLGQLSARPRQTRQIDVPAAGEGVTAYVRQMTGGEREQMEQQFTADKEKGRTIYRARIVQATLCDEAGQLLYGPAELEQINALPAAVVYQVADAADDFNGLSPAAREEAEKKSGDAPRPSTSTDSPTASAASSPSLLSGLPQPS